MPVEGRGLEIGQPNNSETCSEAADGVTRESEGRSRLSLLCPVRQDQPWGYSGTCLCPVPLQQGGTGRGRTGLCGHRSVWGGAVAGRTGACAQGGDIPTGADQTCVHTLPSLPARKSTTDSPTVKSYLPKTCTFITAPQFTTGSKKYDWLNQIQAVGK